MAVDLNPYESRKERFLSSIGDALTIVAHKVEYGDLELGDDNKYYYTAQIATASGDALVTITAKELR